MHNSLQKEERKLSRVGQGASVVLLAWYAPPGRGEDKDDAVV